MALEDIEVNSSLYNIDDHNNLMDLVHIDFIREDLYTWHKQFGHLYNTRLYLSKTQEIIRILLFSSTNYTCHNYLLKKHYQRSFFKASKY